MTERERRALLRRRSDVISWRLLLETARQEHQADLDGAEQIVTVPGRTGAVDPAA